MTCDARLLKRVKSASTSPDPEQVNLPLPSYFPAPARLVCSLSASSELSHHPSSSVFFCTLRGPIMEAKMGKFFESVGNFFTGGDSVPWCDRDIISGCEREVEEADGSAEKKNESIMRLSWALVHSKRPEDVQRGIAMLEASLANASSPLQRREKLYLLAVGFYRSGEFVRSRQLLEQCLEIQPDWRQALTLKKTVEDRVAKDGVIGIGITATAIGLVVGGVAAALARKG